MTSCTSQPQTPVQISIKSPSQSSKIAQEYEDNPPVEASPMFNPSTPVSLRQPSAPPTPPDSSSRNNSINIGISSPLSQANSPSQPLANSQSVISSKTSPTKIPSPSHGDNFLNDNPTREPPKDSFEPSNVKPPTHPITMNLTEANLHAATTNRSCSFVRDFDYDHMLPESSCGSATSCHGLDDTTTTGYQTPNVYINGLPPHFSEQELYALTQPFGDVKSVRSFTRHISEKPTGYGFVLFDNVESAARCIEGLRKYRNLHPSFSKQIHRIPGTSYASESVQSTDVQDDDSFKARMEKLKDESSTNLYIEGLPLTIDEDTLSALVSPHHIKSSRFFKTKLSDPPRIIAFVRLDNRGAAEEIIERLHGRMVRGWNDPGCRISVRFADSTEQRELRRAERSARNGDQSPARLTIAQAALLNLRGQELQNPVRKSPVVHSRGLPGQFSANNGWLSGNDVSGVGTISSNGHHYQQMPVLPQRSNSNAEMAALISSLQNTMGPIGALSNSSDNMRMNALESELYARALAVQQMQARTQALPSTPVFPFPSAGGQTQARNGFTPAEELILHTHARIQRQRAHLQLQQQQTYAGNDTMPMLPRARARAQSSQHRVQGSAVPGQRFPQLTSQSNGNYTKFGCHASLQNTLPAISEDEFHSPAHHEKSLHNLDFGYSPHHDSVFSYPAVNLPKHAQFRLPSSSHMSATALPVSTRSRDQPGNAGTRLNPNNAKHDAGKIINNYHQTQIRHNIPARGVENNDAASFNARPVLSTDESMFTRDGCMSPVIDSPALTFSSRTPSTLSPATPFFGSFGSGQETFETMSEDGEQIEKKLKVRAGTQ